eukprot:204022-Pelagomonas_calceolata.AAC.1
MDNMLTKNTLQVNHVNLGSSTAKQKLLMGIRGYKGKLLMGIRRATGSIRLQNLAMRSIIVFNSMHSGNKLVGTSIRHFGTGLDNPVPWIEYIVVRHFRSRLKSG